MHATLTFYSSGQAPMKGLDPAHFLPYVCDRRVVQTIVDHVLQSEEDICVQVLLFPSEVLVES